MVNGHLRLLGPSVAGASRVTTPLLSCLALLLSALLTAVLLDFGFGRDQGIYAVVADTMARGGAPYRDAWDFKPPGVFAAYTAARMLFGSDPVAVRGLEVLGLASLALAFPILSRRALGDARPGLLGLALAMLSYVPLGFWHTAQPESFGAFLLVWALVAATRAPGCTPSKLPLVAAGALYACAALMKPPLGGGFLVSLAFVVAEHGRNRRSIESAAALAFGGALPVALTLGWFHLHGALPALLETLFGFAPHYTALNLARHDLLELASKSFTTLLDYGTLDVIGCALFLLLPRLTPNERHIAWHVVGVAGMSLLGIGMQAKFFHYHYAAVLVLLALPGGWGFWKLWSYIDDRPLGWLAAVGFGFILLQPFHPNGERLRFFLRDAATRFEAHRQGPQTANTVRNRLEALADVNPETNARVARWLASHTPPDAPIYIWGFEPVVYQLSGRRPASRYIYNVPQRASWSARPTRLELLQELYAQPPAAVVVVRWDPMPQVTGNLSDSAEALQGFPALRELLSREYVHAHDIDDMQIHLRKQQPPIR